MGEKISYMKLLDVTTPEKREERKMNIRGSGWMAVVRADFSWSTSGGLLHEVYGQTDPKRRKKPQRSDWGFGVQRSGQRCGWTLEECAASMRAGDLAFFGMVACVPYARNRRSLPPAPAVHGAAELACGHENEPSLPYCARNGSDFWSRPDASGATPAMVGGDPVPYCPGTDQQFFVREPGRALRTGYVLVSVAI